MSVWEKIKNRNRGLDATDMYVVAGLGNPGREYEATKHNVGFHVIDRLASDYNINISKFKHKAFVGDGMVAGQKTLLVKPQTYMNLSGESIQEILRFYKIPLERFIVIYDDISLSPGTVRIREKGSAGGHNGIKNIIKHLGTDVFLRVKVGVGEKPNGWDLADYVLAPFTKDTLPLMEIGYEKAAHGVELLMTKGLTEAMNQTNQKTKKAE